MSQFPQLPNLVSSFQDFLSGPLLQEYQHSNPSDARYLEVFSPRLLIASSFLSPCIVHLFLAIQYLQWGKGKCLELHKFISFKLILKDSLLFLQNLSPSFHTNSLYSVASVPSFNLNTQILIMMNPLGSYFAFLEQQMKTFSKPVFIFTPSTD